MSKVILVANTDWYLYNFRRSLAQSLAEHGFEVVLVSPAGEYATALQNQYGYRWIEWEIGRQSTAPWRELGSISRLFKLYKHERPDLVHHHTIKPVLYGTIAARIAGISAIVNSITGRGYVFLSPETKATFLKQLLRPVYRLVIRHPGQIAIFENEDDQRYFIQQRMVSEEQTRLIAGVGVDTNRFSSAPEPEGIPIVLYAGRMLWDKGVGILAEAARILHQVCQVRVVLVGAPDPGNPTSISEQQLQSWVAEGLVEWWGWKEDMVSIYQQAAIITLPSFYEGVPTTLLEAASCSRPIVATDTPGCRDVVLDSINGLIVPPKDPFALANALIKLLSDPIQRGRMGAAGRQFVLDKFNVNLVNHSTMAIYQELLSR